jgi:dimethylargininase
MRPVALVGRVTDSYVRATRTHDLGPIDVALCRQQHAAYVDALGALGFDVHRVGSDEANPDGIFVEDQAVVVGSRALVTRSGHPGRRSEADRVASALASLGLDLVRMAEPATLDGGDVLRIGSHLLVGVGHRSNDAGLAVLAATFPECEVHRVPLPADLLHLKCVASSPVPGVAFVVDGALPIDVGAFADRVIGVRPEDAWASNLVGRGDKVIVGAGYPRVEAAIREAGFDPVVVDVSEVRKGDGALTCLSVLVG